MCFKIKKVVVVGAGFGGLSAAALLSRDGFEVTVLEKNEGPGGRASVYQEGGFTFDMGPSWYLMPDVFEKFFSEFGKEPGDFFKLERLDPSYRVYFHDGSVVDVAADIEENFRLFDSLEPEGGRKLKEYLDSAKEKYDLSINEMLYRDYRSLLDLMDGRLIAQGYKLNILESLDSFVRRHFESDKARKIVEYSIGFLGGSPKNTPSFYHIMSHIDLTLGVWYPVGGIRRVAEAVHDVAKGYGAEFRFNEPVTEIATKGGKAVGVRTDSGEYPADVVVVNADYPFSELQLLNPEDRTYSRDYWDSRVIAPSAFVAYLGVKKRVKGLEHHNLFLERDWESSFEQIFDPAKASWPESPSYYVNVPSRTDPYAAPPGCDALFILVALAPGLPDTQLLREGLYSKVINHLERAVGEEINGSVVVKRFFSVNDFKERYNAYKGTALGLTHTMRQTALWRPAHRSKRVDNLYYTGQYTHPGIGVPMTMISSTIVSDDIRKRHGTGMG